MTGIYLGRLGGRYHNSIVMDGARIRIINKSSGRGSSWSEPCRVERKIRKNDKNAKKERGFVRVKIWSIIPCNTCQENLEENGRKK